MSEYVVIYSARISLDVNDKIIILLIYPLVLIKENYASPQPKVLKGQPITYQLQVIIAYQVENASLHTPK